MRRFAGVASTLFACAIGTACGSDEVFTDASPAIDGVPVDANGEQPDAMAQTVTVTTFARCDHDGTCAAGPDVPAAGIPVIRLEPDGTLGTGGVTDASGELVLDDVAPGSSVTVVYTFGANHTINTTTGVQPGDHLVFGEHYFEPPVTGANGTSTVTFPAFTNAVRYRAYHRCQSDEIVDPAPASLTLTHQDYCQTATSDVLLEAIDGTNAIIAVGLIDDAAYTTGGTAALAAWTAFSEDNYTVSVTGIPTEAPGVWTWAYANFGELGDFGSSNLFANEGGGASLVATVPALGTRTWSANELLFQGDLGDQLTLRGGAATATTSTLTTPAVPRLGQITANAALGAVTWIQGAGTYDVGFATLRWNQNESFYQDQWNITFPPGVTSFQWSEIPAALAAELPQTDDFIFARVSVLDLASSDGYDAARQLPSWELECPTCAVREGDETGIDLAYDLGSGEGPVVFFRPTTIRPHAGDATHTSRR